MNYLKRAFISVKRRVGKSVILLVLVFILGNLIAGAISVKQAIRNTDQGIREKLGSVYSIDIDYENMPDDYDWEELNYPDSDTINKIGKSEYVKYYDFNATISLESSKIKRFTIERDDGGPDIGGMFGNSNYFNITGVNYHKVLAFEEGDATLKEGRVFTEDEIKNGSKVILISKKFAELNNLEIGDDIILQNIVYDYEMKPLNRKLDIDSMPAPEFKIKFKNDVELEIIGIFEPKPVIKTGNEEEDWFLDYQDEENQNTIYSTNGMVIEQNNIKQDEESKNNPDYVRYKDYLIPVFVLKDPTNSEKFEKANEHLLPEYNRFSSSADEYKRIAEPMFVINSIASIVLYVAIGASLLILSLTITLFLRDRKYEMGIYLSLGEKKKNVALQIIAEVVCIGFVGITLSLFTGNLIAKSLTQKIVTSQLLEGSEDMYSFSGMRSVSISYPSTDGSISAEEIAENYKVTLDMSTILLFYLVGLGTIVVSTGVPIIYVLRMNPKKIMM